MLLRDRLGRTWETSLVYVVVSSNNMVMSSTVDMVVLGPDEAEGSYVAGV